MVNETQDLKEKINSLESHLRKEIRLEFNMLIAGKKDLPLMIIAKAKVTSEIKRLKEEVYKNTNVLNAIWDFELKQSNLYQLELGDIKEEIIKKEEALEKITASRGYSGMDDARARHILIELGLADNMLEINEKRYRWFRGIK